MLPTESFISGTNRCLKPFQQKGNSSSEVHENMIQILDFCNNAKCYLRKFLHNIACLFSKDCPFLPTGNQWKWLKYCPQPIIAFKLYQTVSKILNLQRFLDFFNILKNTLALSGLPFGVRLKSSLNIHWSQKLIFHYAWNDWKCSVPHFAYSLAWKRHGNPLFWRSLIDAIIFNYVHDHRSTHFSFSLFLTTSLSCTSWCR